MRLRFFLLAASLLSAPALAEVEKPAALVADGIPAVPDELAERTRPYMEFRTASLQGWNPKSRGIAITTRFGNTAQVHEVARPLGMRRQITFEADAIAGASYARGKGDVMVIQKDVGGSEFWQLYRLDNGRLKLITDGKSRNAINAWSHDGRWLAYTSTRRNGADNDIWIVDPREPASNRLLAQVKGGGWGLADFAPDGRSAVVAKYLSVNKTDLYRIDVATGRMTPIGDHSKPISYGGAQFAPERHLVGHLRRGLGFPAARNARSRHRPVHRGRLRSRAGTSRASTFPTTAASSPTSSTRPASAASSCSTRAPAGAAPSPAFRSERWAALEVAPWGDVAVSVSSARSPVRRLCRQSAGRSRSPAGPRARPAGSIPRRNVEPVLVETTSFDGEKVSGFLYRPDPARFPGRRPLHHEHPWRARKASRARASWGATIIYLNELGVALFYPNVRGSTGFGKRFVALDNGPDLRENSVKDIGAFLDVLAQRSGPRSGALRRNRRKLWRLHVLCERDPLR